MAALRRIKPEESTAGAGKNESLRVRTMNRRGGAYLSARKEVRGRGPLVSVLAGCFCGEENGSGAREQVGLLGCWAGRLGWSVSIIFSSWMFFLFPNLFLF